MRLLIAPALLLPLTACELFENVEAACSEPEITVNSTTTSLMDADGDGLEDGVCGPASDECTIHQAIRTAHVCNSGQTIRLQAGETYTFGQDGFFTPAAQRERLGQLAMEPITTEVRIEGSGAILTRDTDLITGAEVRFFYVDGGALTLADLTLRAGSAEERGGAIVNDGTLSVQGCTFEDNVAGEGGAIANLGSLSVQDTTFARNSAPTGGAIHNAGAPEFPAEAQIMGARFLTNSAELVGGLGGGAIYSAGDLRIERSAFVGNRATSGGGLVSNAAFLSIKQSELSENVGISQGGALYLIGEGAVSIENTTIVDNESRNGAGINTQRPDLELRFVTIAFNRLSNDAPNPGPCGLVTSLMPGFGSVRLEGVILSDNEAGNVFTTEPLNVVGENLCSDDTCGGFSMRNTDPALSPLSDNGGPTRTAALSAMSPAVDQGAACGLSEDQRGQPRDGACDLGAFER